uniref:Uncharacterized protein n=1 Tax=Nelumbo nucifera TaxID=4432 RepID=A0A822XIT2_NELNU|nr:TPA_asm: hypothetical protein HUJ06_020359 [Nelumbo nucifera]
MRSLRNFPSVALDFSSSFRVRHEAGKVGTDSVNWVTHYCNKKKKKKNKKEFMMTQSTTHTAWEIEGLLISNGC